MLFVSLPFDPTNVLIHADGVKDLWCSTAIKIKFSEISELPVPLFAKNSTR